MDIFQAIRERRSVRGYQDRPAEKDKLERVMEAATWAPSGMNRQNWYFVVVAGKKVEELTAICAGSFDYIEPTLRELYPDKPKIVEATRKFFTRLGRAPVVIAAYLEPYKYLTEETSIQNVAAAMQNLALAAHAQGLGTCWMTGPVHVAAEIDRFLGIADKKLVAVMTLGYPDETPRVPRRRPDRVCFLGL